MEKISTPWKIVKGTWSSSLLKKKKKKKSFGKMELWSSLKMGVGCGTKQWICGSIKFLVEMKYVSFIFT